MLSPLYNEIHTMLCPRDRLNRQAMETIEGDAHTEMILKVMYYLLRRLRFVQMLDVSGK